MLYYCNVCIITTRNLHDFNKHLLTKKHIKNKTKQVYDNSFNVTVSSVNECNVMLTISDIPNTTAQSERAIDKNPKCNYCNMKDANDTSKSDVETEGNIVIPNTSQTDSILQHILENIAKLNEIMIDTTKNSQETIKQSQEMMMKMIDVYKQAPPSITNNIYNHNGDNNTFNLNLFLNEKCKNAMNITEFVDSIEVTMDDIENVGRSGYVEGISSIFIDNLRNTDINKRPIHCTDRKREILYVKDDDRWERTNVDSEKLKHAVLRVEKKHMLLIPKWADEHPGCEKSDNYGNDKYMSICRNVTDGTDDKMLKIVKNIAKKMVIDKDMDTIS